MNLLIRPIKPQDNEPMETLIRWVIRQEFALQGEGYVTSDLLSDLFELYQQPGSRYWVIEDQDTHRILGGGGFARLKGTAPEEGLAELQKLYFLPEIRGLGLGKQLMQRILKESENVGHRQLYLETIPEMQAAIQLYQAFGFHFIDHHLGNTGHHERCQVYMKRESSPILQKTEPISTLTSNAYKAP